MTATKKPKPRIRSMLFQIDYAVVSNPASGAPVLEMDEYGDGHVRRRVKIELTASAICYLAEKLHAARKVYEKQTEEIKRALEG